MTQVDKKSSKNYQRIVFHSILTFIGQQAMQVTDLLFCRNLGSVASATVGTSATFIAWFMIVGLGLVSSLEYFIPHSLGAQNEKKAHSYFYAGLATAMILSTVSMLGLLGLSHLVSFFGVNAEIQSSVQLFCSITAPSYFAIFMVPALRVELQARGHSHDSTYAFVFANLLNIFLNWVLVLGHLGAPAMGIRGSAYANVLSRFALLFYLMFRVWRVRSGLKSSLKISEVPYVKYMKNLLKMGLPTSLHMLFEMGAFVFVSTLAARLKPSQNAAHSISLTIASFVFMIPLGLSSAASITMSEALGKKQPGMARHFAGITIKIGMANALFISTCMVLLRRALVSLYTIDEETIRIGSNLILITAIFQFGDAMQVILAGCLRGVGETRVQAKINGIGHWLIGIPLGIILGFFFKLEIVGLWIGLCVGLFAVAGGLFLRWRKTATALEAEGLALSTTLSS